MKSLGVSLVLPVLAAIAAGPVAAQDWTGLYGGVTLGLGAGEGTHTTSGNTFGTAATDAAEFGALLGYGFQAGSWVIAPELQVMLGNGDAGTFFHSSGMSDMTLETRDISTVSLRVGHAFDRFLLSGSLGVAWGHVDATYTSTSAPNPLVLQDQMQGTVAGVAGDYDLGNGWRLRGEVRHFEGLSGSNPDTPYPDGGGTYLSQSTRNYDRQDVTVSIIRNF